MKAGRDFQPDIADLARDLFRSLRGLARRPLFSGAVILVLALGIGATTAVLTLVDAVMISPLPFADPGRLVTIRHAAPPWGLDDAGQTAAWHLTYEEETRVFDALGMYGGASVSVTGDGPPESVPALQVTEGVLRALRAKPAAGRAFLRDDMVPGGPGRVMLAYGYWQSRYGGDPSVVGRTLQVDGRSHEIIGVAPAELRSLGAEPSLLLPLVMDRASLFVGNIGYGSVGRLADGVSMEAAGAELNRVLPQAWDNFPGGPVASFSPPDQFSAEVYPFKDGLIGSVADFLWVMLAGGALVLLIACANVANLFLVRAHARAGEMAVRSALGASGKSIGWEYVKDGLILGILGGGLGLVLALLLLNNLVQMAPVNLPRLAEVTLNARVLISTVLISLGSGLAFGLLPALGRSRLVLASALKEGGRSRMGDRRGRRAQDILVMSQMALALVLLVASGLMLRSFHTIRQVDPGFRNPEDVLVLRLYIPYREISSSAEVAATYEAIVRRVEQIPGVASVGLATALPMDGQVNNNAFLVRGRESTDQARRHKWIGEGYLETLGIPLLAGRSITWADVHQRAPIALLSETLARELFGSPEAAIGQQVAARPDPPVWKEVVGVVKDVREDGMDRPPPPLVYWPQVTLGFWEGDSPDQIQVYRGFGLAIRSSRIGNAGFRKELEQAIWEVSPNLPLIGVRTMPELMMASTARTSFLLILLGVAAVMALILSVVGVYGVMSYAVSQRTRELGVRMALGARQGNVIGMVLGHGALIGGTGIGAGLFIAILATRTMSALLYGVEPTDPATFGLVAGGLFVVALLASYIPAWRAARVDPLVALRSE